MRTAARCLATSAQSVPRCGDERATVSRRQRQTGTGGVAMSKTIYRVIKESADYIANDEFRNRAEAVRWAKRVAGNGTWASVYVLKQNCFDAWNTGEEIFRVEVRAAAV